tara:strand:+ start:223 stop:555 length:333 start_codon:yes stop_codon:yes gene_type:complete
MGELVDLNKFRIEKAEEEERLAAAAAEEAAIAADEEAQDEIEYMKEFLDKLIGSLGAASSVSSSADMGYYPMTDDDYFSYNSETGYDEDGGYYETYWVKDDEDDEDDESV